MIVELSTLEIKEFLDRTDPDGLLRLESLESRGINLTPMQMRLMFLPRGYGKSFMSMCNLMSSMDEHEEFVISFEEMRGSRLPYIIPKEEDLNGTYQRNLDYIMKLICFINEYYSEYSIIRKTKLTIILNRKVYI